MVEPYVLFTNIEGDSAVGVVGDVDVDVDFDTILDNLDAGAMIHSEIVHKSGWGLMIDYGMMDLRGDKRFGNGGRIDARIKQQVLDAALMYRMVLDPYSSWDIFLGTRTWDNELRLKVNPGLVDGQRTASTEPGWTDGYIGGRYSQRFAQNWSWQIYGDLGMGEADFTASAKAGIGYRFNDTWAMEFLYKGTWVDYEEGRPGTRGYFAYDTVTHGPLLGLIINF